MEPSEHEPYILRGREVRHPSPQIIGTFGISMNETFKRSLTFSAILCVCLAVCGWLGLATRNRGRTLDQKWGVDPAPAQGGDDGRSLPVVVGHSPDAAPTLRAAPIVPDYLPIESRLIDEDQAPRILLRLLVAPSQIGFGLLIQRTFSGVFLIFVLRQLIEAS